MSSSWSNTAGSWPSIEEIVGTPEEVAEDASRIPQLPRLPLWARCTWCWTLNQVGYFYWPDDPISLDDGTTTTFNDWKYEAAKASYGKGQKRRFHCTFDNAITDHIADKG